MFYSTRQRSFCRPCKRTIKVPSLPMSTPIFVKASEERYIKFNGKVGKDGFSIVGAVGAPVGYRICVRIVLLGTGMVVETEGKVVKVNKVKDGFEIICFFVSSSPEIEKTICQWIGSLSHRQQWGTA